MDRLGFGVGARKLDPQDKNDWVIEFIMNLERSRQLGVPSLVLSGCGPLGELINVTRWRV